MVKGADNKWVLFVIMFGVISVFLYAIESNLTSSSCPHPPELFFGNKKISVILATTTVDRDRGLSGVSTLPENVGMLFVFEKPATRNFWMKDMLFPLDIIWLDQEMYVIGVVEGATPESYPHPFASPPGMAYTLEVLRGQARVLNIATGTAARLVDCDSQP